MGFELGQRAGAAGYALRVFDEIGSTSAEALALARTGQAGPVWIVARRQTAGRGRRGRVWETPAGNLATSLMLSVKVAPALAATLGFVAGLSLNRAIAEVAPRIAVRVGLDGLDGPGQARLTLKWPNDVLGDGAKLAGVLLEVEAINSHIAVVIGLGVNVAAQPHGLPYPVTSLAALGADVSAEGLFSALTDAWTELYSLWDRGHGLGEIRRLWLEQAAGLGAPVAVQLGDETIRGTFETLDEEGRLVVLTETGARRVVAAGEVHFGAAATVR
jgi:BirA family biotin operon repressor/biotin-[acetyl-CoA-carboxylase] ligase